MKSLTILWICSFWLILSNIMEAQNGTILKRATVFRELTSRKHKVVEDTLWFNTQDTLKVSVVADLSDTLHIAAMHVSFGTGTDTTQLFFNKRFVFDQSGNFSDGTGYRRVRRRVFFLIGSDFKALNYYHARVRLEYDDGTYSPVMYYHVQR